MDSYIREAGLFVENDFIKNVTPEHESEKANDTNISDIYNLIGPQRDSLAIVVPITIIYSVIFITGIIGNISTCIVIRKNRSMHTATNYYLFSLAISDLILLLSGVPNEIYSIWFKYPYVFGEAFCIGRGLAAETSANATILTITAFTAERYVAICHPFMSHAMSKLNRVTRIILIIWFTSLLTAAPQAAQFGIQELVGIPICNQVRVIFKHSFEISTFIFFFTPMSIIFVLYLLIGLKLRRASLLRPVGSILHRSVNTSSLRSQSYQGNKRVLKMLVAVVVAFFICWAPFHAQRLVAIYSAGLHIGNPTMINLYNIMTYVSGVLYYMSTCINPFLYNIMSNKFREAFKETLEQFNVCSSKEDEPQRQYRVLSRSKRLRVAFQESTDYTSSSQRDESFQSCSSWNYNKTMTPNRQRNIIFRELNTNDYDTVSCTSRTDLSASHNDKYLTRTRSIIKIDEIDLPTADASLNVLYTKQGDIQIRLQKKLPHNKTQHSFVRLLSRFTRAFKSKPSPAHVGFYTPPIDETASVCSYPLGETTQPCKYSNQGQSENLLENPIQPLGCEHWYRKASLDASEYGKYREK